MTGLRECGVMQLVETAQLVTCDNLLLCLQCLVENMQNDKYDIITFSSCFFFNLN